MYYLIDNGNLIQQIQEKVVQIKYNFFSNLLRGEKIMQNLRLVVQQSDFDKFNSQDDQLKFKVQFDSSIYINLMEYQLKKEQILSSVQYTNLLSFSLVQNKLERNFKSIVEALLLNQTKTDDILSKTDQLEDKINVSGHKTAQDIDALKNTMRQFNDRLSKLESQGLNPVPHPPTGSNDSASSKNVRDAKKQGSTKNFVGLMEPPQTMDRSSLYDKKFDDLQHQISALKEKMPTLQLMESQLQNMKRQFTGLKGQLITFANKSNKNIKRQSINSNANTNGRKQGTPKIGRASLLNHSNSTVILSKDTQNKQNKPTSDFRDMNTSKVEVALERNDSQFDKEIEGLHFEVNTLNLCYQELKVLVEDLRRKDIKAHSVLSQIEDKQKKIQDQMRKDTENFQKQIKNIQVNMINAQSYQPEPQVQVQQKKTSPRSKSPSLSTYDDNTINFKNQLNDRISKLQSSLQGFVTQTEFTRFKTEARAKMEEQQKKHDKFVNEYEEQIKKIYDMFINKDLDINRLNELIGSTSELIKQNSAQADRKHNIAIARCQELKKNIQNLREDVEFYQSMNAEKQKKTTQSDKPVQKQTEASQKQKQIDTKAIEQLKKYFNNKLHDQRAYLVGLVRDLEKKQSTANGVSQQIANIWDKINEINLFLNKKADSDDIKKNLIYLQKKIGRLEAHLMKGEDNTQDARIAKTSWFCLSCDKNLLGYQGKIGRHVVWDQMPLKGMVKGTIQKKGLPSLKSK